MGLVMHILSCLMLTLILLAACYPIDTATTYNKNWTRAVSTSEPIYLSFKDNQHASYHFTLKHDTNSGLYLLTVYWNAPDKEPLFNGVKTSLKFLVDKEHIITLYPIKTPKTIGYDIDSKGHQEEAVFSLDYNQLKAIATAQSVQAQLSGKYLIVSGYFNKRHTFKAFKEFLDNAPI